MRWFSAVTVLVCVAITSSAASSQPWLVLDAGGHTADIRRIFITPDCQRVITASFDRSIRIWDVVTGETLRIIRFPVGPGNEGVCQAMALSPDGKTIAASPLAINRGREGSTIFIIDVETGLVIVRLKKHTNAVSTLAFSADGRFLASGCTDKSVYVWDTATWKDPVAVMGHSSTVGYIAMSPDGKRLASVTADRLARLWPNDTSTKLIPLKDGSHHALCVAWSPDGLTVAVGNTDGTISLWDPDGKYRKTLQGLNNYITSLSFTPDSSAILQTGFDRLGKGNARFDSTIVEIATGKELSRFRGQNNAVYHGSLSADGKLAVTAGGNDIESHLWRTSDGTRVQTFRSNARSLYGIGWDDTKETIAWSATNTTSRRAGGGYPLERAFSFKDLRFVGNSATPFGQAVMKRGNRTLHINAQREMVVSENGKPLLAFCEKRISDNDSVLCCSWLPDGRILVGQAFSLHLYDPETLTIVRSYKGAIGGTAAIAPSADGKRFVTADNDLIMRVWNVEDQQPRLSLFSTGSEWVAWTGEGYYAASAGGERLMGWQLNAAGADGPGTWYAAGQFHKSLFQPVLISRVLSEGSVAAAAKATGLGSLPKIDDTLPPTVSIVSPSGLGELKTKGRKFEVKATARPTGTYPIMTMRLLVNGRPFNGAAGMRTDEKAATGETLAAWTVDLPPGLFSISAVAETTVSLAVSAPVEIRVPGAVNEKPALYILAVGINDYPEPMQLRFAAPDADLIAESFQKHGKDSYSRIETKLIKNKDATKKGVEAGLDWLAGKMSHQDVGIFFFSGHGDRSANGGLFLITADVDAKNVAGTCLSGESLKAKLATTPGRIIAMLDACHSGATGPREKPSATDDLVRELVSEQYGIVVMSSSLGWEYSLESPEYRQGYFTKAVAEALEGKADSNTDGLIHLKEVEIFAGRRVPELTHGRQHPITARPAAVRSFPLLR